jgi:hypothetical protein
MNNENINFKRNISIAVQSNLFYQVNMQIYP